MTGVKYNNYNEICDFTKLETDSVAREHAS